MGLVAGSFALHLNAAAGRCQFFDALVKNKTRCFTTMRRFWEHQIRDDNDFARHVDYVHWNPVKHGLVTRADDCPYSTFHRFVKDGVYPSDWGLAQVEISNLNARE